MKQQPVSARLITGLLVITLVILSIFLGYTQELHRLQQRKNRILSEKVASLEYSCSSQENNAAK